MSVVKRFLEWISLKNRLHHSISKTLLFNEGEVWWCSVGENVGSEINGKSKLFSRPVLILKKFSSNLFLGLPTSTKPQKVRIWCVPIFINRKMKTSVILSQARVFDIKRLSNLIGTIDETSLIKTKKAFRRLFL